MSQFRRRSDGPTPLSMNRSINPIFGGLAKRSESRCSAETPKSNSEKTQTRPLFTMGGHDQVDPSDLHLDITKGIRTLIVEDNPVDQRIIEDIASRLGLRIELVDNGNDAVELLKKADGGDYFDLVLIDFSMPELDGLTASKYIKQELKLRHLPKIMMLSAYKQEDIFRGSVDKQSVDRYLEKPILIEELNEALFDLSESLDDGEIWPNPHRLDDEILANARVLLAEDNIINQRVAVGMLSLKGIDVTIVNNGQEAVDKLFGLPPNTFDIVLMDMDMPKMDGYEATRIIKNNDAYLTLPVVALTAHNKTEDKIKSQTSGVSKHLTKPVKPAILYDTLLEFLRDENQN
ncbi:hypothetical protein NBRC116493_06050 [Aurantivibrio infirmus]